MNIKKSIVGVKYFRYVSDDEVEIIRILNDSNPNEFKYKFDGSSIRGRITKEKLEEDYCKLTPDGVIYFNIVDVGELEDVMIMGYRTKDINEKSNFPWMVCRQCITDIFANTINPDYNNLIAGVAISQDTLPEKIPMETILTCDGIKKSVCVSIYMDDTLNDILSLIKTKPYDTVLYNLFADHVRYKYKGKIKEHMSKELIDGYSKSLKNLMVDNEFMYEFYRGFGIFPVTFDITDDEINSGTLCVSHKIILSNLIMRKIEYAVVIPFSKNIDLSKIERDYMLLMDAKDKLYIIGYSWEEEMEINIERIETEENISKMIRIPGYDKDKNILRAFLKFNTNKYENMQ